MRTLIVYGSKYGYTEYLSKLLEKRLDGQVDRIAAKRAGEMDLSVYDRVIVGSPIYIGNIYKEVKRFLDLKREELMVSDLRFFVVGLGGPVESMKNFNESLDAAFILHSKDNAYFGGTMNLGRMNFIERAVIKSIAKRRPHFDGVNEEEIDRFVNALNQGGRE